MAKIISLLCLLLSIAFVLANGIPEVEIYELSKGSLSLNFTNYGATILSLVLPDKNGKLDDIVLSFNSLDDFKNLTTPFGNIVGRVANRIAGAQFTLNGTVYKLNPNKGRNMLHGGKLGFADVVWSVSSYKKDSHITFAYDSFDGEEGFPGAVSVWVTYMFIRNNEVGVKMVAKPLNKATPVNLAQHTFWNLDGHSSGDILSHTIKLFASQITPVDSEYLPTGSIIPVIGTPYDFVTSSRLIGSRINEVPGGYDINYVIDGSGSKSLVKVAEVNGKVSGRKMEVWSNEVGVQFYTANTLNIEKGRGKGGVGYSNFTGFCLETQGFPDAVNHPNFPSQIVNPGQTYEHIMVFRFTV